MRTTTGFCCEAINFNGQRLMTIQWWLYALTIDAEVVGWEQIMSAPKFCARRLRAFKREEQKTCLSLSILAMASRLARFAPLLTRPRAVPLTASRLPRFRTYATQSEHQVHYHISSSTKVQRDDIAHR